MVTDEQAKAVKEVAKTTGTVAELGEKVGGFISKVIGPACFEVGGVLADYTRYFRYKNLLSISDKVKAIHARRKLEGKEVPIPPRIAIPLLESASLEDDETLKDVWATLIANGTDPNSKTILHPGYIEIIKQMSPDEAIILNSFLKFNIYPILFSYHVPEIYQLEKDTFGFAGWRKPNQQMALYQAFYELFLGHCRTLQLRKADDSRIYLDNMLRLRIIDVGHKFLGEDKKNAGFPWRDFTSKEEQ